MTRSRLVGITAPLPGTCRIAFMDPGEGWHVDQVALLAALEVTDDRGRVRSEVVPLSWDEAVPATNDLNLLTSVGRYQLCPNAADATALADRQAQHVADKLTADGHHCTVIQADTDPWAGDPVPSPIGSGTYLLSSRYIQHDPDCPVCAESA